MSTQSILDEAENLWEKGCIDEVLALLRAAYLRSPGDPEIAFQFGHRLGQHSFQADSSRRHGIKQEAVSVLTKLSASMQDLDPMEQWKIQRHLYLYSGRHLENIALGHAEIARGNALGILSVGFGCLHQALELIDAEKFGDALPFAKQGADAFRTLLEIDAPKPGRYLAFSLTLGILGQRDEAYTVTHKAGVLLSKRVEDLQEHCTELERLLALAQDAGVNGAE